MGCREALHQACRAVSRPAQGPLRQVLVGRHHLAADTHHRLGVILCQGRRVAIRHPAIRRRSHHLEAAATVLAAIHHPVVTQHLRPATRCSQRADHHQVVLVLVLAQHGRAASPWATAGLGRDHRHSSSSSIRVRGTRHHLDHIHQATVLHLVAAATDKAVTLPLDTATLRMAPQQVHLPQATREGAAQGGATTQGYRGATRPADLPAVDIPGVAILRVHPAILQQQMPAARREGNLLRQRPMAAPLLGREGQGTPPQATVLHQAGEDIPLLQGRRRRATPEVAILRQEAIQHRAATQQPPCQEGILLSSPEAAIQRHLRRATSALTAATMHHQLHK